MNRIPVKLPAVAWNVAAAVLWLATVYFGLAAIVDVIEVARTIYALVGSSYYTGVLIGQVTAVLAGLFWLLAIIITGEYHMKHHGERKALLFSAVMLAVEFTILGAGAFLFLP